MAKLTKKQIQQRKVRRELKAARQRHHELNKSRRDAKRKTVTGSDTGPVRVAKGGARARRRHRRNGHMHRVGGR